MKIAIVHFHLKTGGVTSVIREQADIIKKRGHSVLVVCGLKSDRSTPFSTAVVPGLAYDAEQDNPFTPPGIAGEVLGAIKAAWPGGADILHVHNPTLAKNRHLQTVLKLLQQTGVRLLCQIHDFAEDGRPNAYFKEPYVTDCHYAVLNQRDVKRLQMAGLDENGLHLLPNPVNCRAVESDVVSGDGPVVYPVRAIRRKNIGEAILLSLFWGNRPLWITLPPNSAADYETYEQWRCFVANHRLPVVFDVGLHHAFASIMRTACCVLTTSITEGFGYAFLEPWMYGKNLWGRRLTDICGDFRTHGIYLDHLYDRLKIPLDAMESREAATVWQQGYARAGRLMGIPISGQACLNAWGETTAGGQIDFGLLNETMQRKVILAVLQNNALRQAVAAANPFLDALSAMGGDPGLIARNREAVWRTYRPERYAERLMTAYRITLDTPVRHRIHKKKLAESFLTPKTFSLLKWG